MRKLLWIALMVVATAGTAILAEPAFVEPYPSDASMSAGEFRLDGGIDRPASRASSGGGWTVSQSVTVTAAATSSQGFSLLAARGIGKAAGAGCLCGGVFSDGFESGDTSAWSTATMTEPQ